MQYEIYLHFGNSYFTRMYPMQYEHPKTTKVHIAHIEVVFLYSIEHELRPASF